MKKWIMIGLAALAVLASQVACDSSTGGGGSVTSCPPPQQLTCVFNPNDGTTRCYCINPPQ